MTLHDPGALLRASYSSNQEDKAPQSLGQTPPSQAQRAPRAVADDALQATHFVLSTTAYHVSVAIGKWQKQWRYYEHALACSLSYWATVYMDYLAVAAMVVRQS